MNVLGIDVGGSGIKAAVVDTESGTLLTDRVRIPTPKSSTPKKVTAVVEELVNTFEWKGPVGCGFPSVVADGVTHTAANISNKWIGENAAERFSEATGCPFHVANDADVAGLAEMRFGAGRDRDGVVCVLTLGTGIGSAFFIDGQLFPNTELGHLEIDGREAEAWASDRARKKEDLGWKKWSRRVDRVLTRIHDWLRPDVFILGGGVSKRSEKFLEYLSVPAEVVPALLQNHAGIVGAALYARESNHDHLRAVS